TLGTEGVHAVLVGLPADQFSEWSACVDGDMPKPGGAHKLVIGTGLARRLGLKTGDTLHPFYRNDSGERLSKIVGIFKPDAPLWKANRVLPDFAAAEHIFDQAGWATDFLVDCDPQQKEAVTRMIEQEIFLPATQSRGIIRLNITAREDLLAILPRDLLHQEGIFNLHFLMAFIVSILVLLVTSGLGLSERRRGIGILKATGWQTDEVLLRNLAESLTLAIIAACVSLLLAWFWLRVLNGYWIAGLLIPGVSTTADFQVPFRLTPVPALLAFVLALVVVLVGTLYSTWRAAPVAPREAMR